MASAETSYVKNVRAKSFAFLGSNPNGRNRVYKSGLSTYSASWAVKGLCSR